MVLGRLQTQHRDTCLPSTRSPFSPFTSQLLSIHTLTNFVPVSPLESALTKPSLKSIKTRDFKFFRIRSYSTPPCNPLIKKHLHIHGGRGEGSSASSSSCISFASSTTPKYNVFHSRRRPRHGDR